MKFKAPFKGVKEGDIYHTDFSPGDECPPELEEAARACDAIETGHGEAPKRQKTKA